MKDKTPTERAFAFKRLAYEERRDKPGAALESMYERLATEALTLAELPAIGAGGEVVKAQRREISYKREIIQDTLARGATRIAEDASIQRADLLMQPSFNAVAMGIDAAQSIKARNSFEKMLAHQLAVAHESCLRLMDRALSYETDGRHYKDNHVCGSDSVEACRLANASARLMSVFQEGLLTLQRLRTGGNQTVTVQHVNVESGAQAVIGNVRTGGRKRGGGRNGK